MEKKVGLPEVLKYLRHTEAITQKQLAEETGLSLSAIVSYENGLREPNSKAMAVLESYFSVSGEYLRGDLKDRSRFLSNSEQVSDGLDELSVLYSAYSDTFRLSDQARQQMATEILNNTISFLNHNVLKKEKNAFTSEQYELLLSRLTELNSDGVAELIKRADELVHMEWYKNTL